MSSNDRERQSLIRTSARMPRRFGRACTGAICGLLAGATMSVTLAPESSYLPVVGATVGVLSGIVGGSVGRAVIGALCGLMMAICIGIPLENLACHLHSHIDWSALRAVLRQDGWNTQITALVIIGTVTGTVWGAIFRTNHPLRTRHQMPSDAQIVEFLKTLERQSQPT